MTNEVQETTQEMKDAQKQQDQFIAIVQIIASVAHGLNKRYCESLGDNSIPTWEEAPDWMVQSAIDGVGFHLMNPDATPDQSHKNWMAQKTRDGWVYGKEKNPELKMHPCMVKYDELPQHQRSKDYIFSATVHELSKIFNLNIV